MLIRDTRVGAAAHAPYGVRAVSIAVLRAASRALDALAARLQPEEREASSIGVVEYHAEAGAPEGALYIDGQLVGYVMGVQRL